MQSVAQHVADGKVLDLIQRCLAAGVMEDGVFKPTTVGTPQGGVVSPLLANIALNHIRELTVRKHNLEAETVTKLNRVIRGTANYFATPFATSRWQFQKLDSWVRMRLRCMKRKRKSYNDNRTLRARYFLGKLGLLTLEQFCRTFDNRGKACQVIPRCGATLSGVAR